MTNLDLQHFRLIKYIIEEGSMVNATQKMFLSQSALSHKLRELESSLGVKVFDRKNKKLRLTESGAIIYEYGKKILVEFEELEKELIAIKQFKTERIRISTECYTSYHWLPAVIKEFKKTNPTVQVEVVTAATRKPMEYLENGKLDIAITEKKPVNTHNYQIDLLFEDEFLLVFAKNSKYSKLEKVNTNDLNGADLLLYDMDEKNSIVLNQFIKPNQITLNSLNKMQLTEGIIEMVSADLGVTIMASWIVIPYLKPKKLIALSLPKTPLKRQWYAIRHDFESEAQINFVNLLKKKLG
jgi:LysR family transcriptional regulator, regulator for metE and metH